MSILLSTTLNVKLEGTGVQEKRGRDKNKVSDFLGEKSRSRMRITS